MARAAMWIGGIIIAILLLWGAVHVLIPPVNPAQKTPKGHFQSACWLCHFVSSSAKVVNE